MHQTVSEMLRTTPSGAFTQGDVLARCIEACFDCAQACVACADACLGEESVGMLRRCIRLNLDCADICESAGRQLLRQQEPDVDLLRRALELTELASRSCAAECERHAERHEHCRVCAEVCRACEHACQQLLAAFTQARPEAPH